MIPHKLTLHNFLCYADATLDFHSLHLACISGENGHGKSAILDAITWALWGKSRAQRDDDLIRLGETSMAVEFEFLLGQNHYRILRKRKSEGRGSSALELQIKDAELGLGDPSRGALGGGDPRKVKNLPEGKENLREGAATWRAISGDNMRDTQGEINHLLHMEYDTFINSAFLVQGRADEFTTKAPAERKRVLGEILDLSFYDRVEELAKAEAKVARTEAVAIEAAILEMDRELEQREVYRRELAQETERAEALEAELREIQEQVREAQEKVTQAGVKRERLAEMKGEADRQLRELQELKGRITGAEEGRAGARRSQEELEEVKGKLAALEPLEAERESHEGEIKRLSVEQAGLSATNEKLKEEMATLKEEMALLGAAEARCPLCESELTPEHRDEILAEKQAKGERAGADYRANKDRLAAIEEEIRVQKTRLGMVNSELAQGVNLRQKELNLAARVAALEAEGERLAEWTERMQELEAASAQARERMGELEHEVRNADQLAIALKGMQTKAGQLNDDASWARRKVGAAQQKLDHCDYVEKEKARRLEEQAKSQEQAGIYDELKVAFGKKGIQAMIIEAAIPEIEDEANRLLGRMSDGRMSVALKSQRESQKGDTLETLDIEVSDEMGARDYALYSGGEKFRVNFAIRLAISGLLARRAGAQLQTLIIDEGFGTQDASGRERLVEAIGSVQGEFSKILVITHIDELRDAFPTRIEVVKGPAGSVISVN